MATAVPIAAGFRWRFHFVSFVALMIFAILLVIAVFPVSKRQLIRFENLRGGLAAGVELPTTMKNGTATQATVALNFTGSAAGKQRHARCRMNVTSHSGDLSLEPEHAGRTGVSESIVPCKLQRTSALLYADVSNDEIASLTVHIIARGRLWKKEKLSFELEASGPEIELMCSTAEAEVVIIPETSAVFQFWPKFLAFLTAIVALAYQFSDKFFKRADR